MSSRNSSSKGNSADAEFAYIIRQCMLFSYFFTIFAAGITNSVVLIAMYFDKRLHNANKYFVACLAVSDLMVAMFSVTIRLHQYMNHDVPLTIHACRFWIWIDIFSETASITTLTIISIDRYFKVAKPFKYKIMMSTRKSRIIIVFLWLYSAIVASLGMIPYQGYKGVHITSRKTCVNDNKAFYTLAALLGFFIPVIILIIMCSMMFRIVKNFHQRRSTCHDARNTETGSTAAVIPRIHSTTRTGKRVNSNRRTVGIFSLVVCTFIVCWGPFFILFVIFQYNAKLISMSPRGRQVLFVICFNILPYANSFLNPVIYAYFDKSFNLAIKELLLRIRGKPRHADSTASYALAHLRTHIENS